ncbi:hypothetical protein N826_07080 [Skermanella aerolata KACC 11604]|nr:hypothetical protein N826_07080 [Skermanella aerolata KACC 11604]
MSEGLGFDRRFQRAEPAVRSGDGGPLAPAPQYGPLFQNLSPVEAMIEGGIPFMLEVRRYVDASSQRH